MKNAILCMLLALCAASFASTAEARPKRPHHRAKKPVATAPEYPRLEHYRAPVSYKQLCVAITAAKRLLADVDIADVRRGTARDAALAVWNPDGDRADIRVIQVRGGESKTPGFLTQATPWNGLIPDPSIDLYNGVNTTYKVYARFDDGPPKRWHVLALKMLTKLNGVATYVPYSPAYQTKEVVANGRQYLLDVMSKAKARINALGVRSHAVPGKLVSEAIDDTVLLSLLVIEHTDKDEDRIRGSKWATDKMLVTVALNRENVYRYAVSSAGAGGLAQFIPGTYKGTRAHYPEAKLPASFEEGMRDHVHAVVAQYCLADYSYTELLEERVRKPRTLELLGSYLAAAYNAGEGRAIPAYRRHANRCRKAIDRRVWCHRDHDLPGETVNYLRKFTGTYRYLLATK